MSANHDHESTSLAAMPCILVVVTMGYLFVMHAGHLVRERKEVQWSGPGLERIYQEVGAGQVRAPVNRLRARIGLRANDVVPRDDELYYLPDIAHVTGRNFLAPVRKQSHVVLSRERGAEREANPLPAILEYDRELRARGVRLVLLPTPSKAMFAGPGAAPLRNAGFAAFLAEMAAHDLAVFDLGPHFAEFARRGNPLFLRSDSHWTPEAMRLSAVLLAAFLEREGLRPERPGEILPGGTETITNAGDLAILLEGQATERWLENIAVHPVRGPGGEPWRPDAGSPLLVLGDSFTNVFSLGEMGWGAEAGFAEALSQTLGFRVDRLARNADGAFASRQALLQEAGGLEGKSVVVWQFAARELSFGDWKVLPAPRPGPRGGETAEGTIELQGTVAAVAPVPHLTRTPYRRAVLEVRLTDVRSAARGVPGEVVLLGLGVEERVPTAMTKWQPGRTVNLTVVPWREVEEQFGRLHRFALEDPEFELLDAARFWMAPAP